MWLSGLFYSEVVVLPFQPLCFRTMWLSGLLLFTELRLSDVARLGRLAVFNHAGISYTFAHPPSSNVHRSF